MGKYYLHEKIGTVCMVLEPDAYTSAAIAASDNDTGVPVNMADNILFILQYGDQAAGAANATQLQLFYASDGAASNASAIDTDSIFTAVDTDDVNEVFLLDLDLGGKSLTDDTGKVFVVSTAALGSAADFAVLGIPYNLKRTPSTNENTVQFIGETST